MKCDMTGNECAGNNRFGCFECGQAALSDRLNSLVSLVAKQDEYIEAIIAEASGLAVIASKHGWKSARYEQGVKLRAEIEQLRQEANASNQPTSPCGSTEKPALSR